MKDSIFNPDYQQKEIQAKIISSLERISEAFRVLLWDHAKVAELSPIQIQLLVFIAYHPEELSQVSHLAEEFNMTKPTVSDAIRVLHQKGYLDKKPSTQDKRVYTLHLTEAGKRVLEKVEHFANPLQTALGFLKEEEQVQLFQSLNQFIYDLNRQGIIRVQRTCRGCRFYEKKGEGKHFCHLLQQDLQDRELRVDCPEFEAP